MFYKLSTDGDQVEKDHWLLISNYFLSYEKFWIKYIVPLTNRPGNINFKSDARLLKEGKGKQNIDIAMLNYSLFRHLIRAYKILDKLKDPLKLEDKLLSQFDLVLEGMTRLVAAQDNAFELLEKINKPSCYKPFDNEDSKLAKQRWQKTNKFPLAHIRKYRNSLVHNVLPPSIYDGDRLCLPKIGTEQFYKDWRIVTDPQNNPGLNKDHFISTLLIFEDAWNTTVDYMESQWKNL